MKASKLSVFKDKLDCINNLTTIAQCIVESNYHTTLLATLKEESNSHELPEAREMFNTWSLLFEEQLLKGLDIIAMFAQFNDRIIEARDILESFDSNITRNDPRVNIFINEIESDKLLITIIEGIDVCTNSMIAPMSMVVTIIKNYIPQSNLLKEEKILHNLN